MKPTSQFRVPAVLGTKLKCATEDMENQGNLNIVCLANYEYILYRSGIGKLYLLLTRENGFGVYDYLIEASFTNLDDSDLTKKEIYSLLRDYQLNPNEFAKNHKSIELDASEMKAALREWRERNLS